MGSGASTAAELSSNAVAEHVGNITQLSKYKGKIIEKHLNGEVLQGLDDKDVDKYLDELKVSVKLHRTRLKEELKNYKRFHGNQAAKNEAIAAVKSEYEEIVKFETKPEYIKFGNDDDFRDGLTRKIKDLVNSMQDECYNNEGGRWRKEFDYVVNEAAIEKADDVFAHRIRDFGHTGMRLQDFMNLPDALEAKLTEAEVASLRMYTGPLYVPWNTALRTYESDPSKLTSWATCVSVLYSAILKLRQRSPNAPVYRGVNEKDRELPQNFIQAAEGGFAGGVEPAFMSTTLDRAVALEYATRNGTSLKCSVMEISVDAGSRGANVRAFSQFPYEAELLYTPCTYLTVESVRVITDGALAGIRCLTVRATMSTARPDTQGIVTVRDRNEAARAVASSTRVIVTVSEARMGEMMQLKAMNVPVQQCLKAGFSVSELKSVGDWLALTDFVGAGCAARQLYDAGYTLDELVSAGVLMDKAMWKSLFTSGKYSLSQLKASICPGTFLKEFGVRPDDLLEAGYPQSEVFSIEDRKTKYREFDVISKMGYSNDDIRKVFTVAELKTQKVPFDIIKSLGYPNDKLSKVFTTAELKAQNVAFDGIRSLGYSNDKIRRAFTVPELKAQNVAIDVIRTLGYPNDLIRNAFTVAELKSLKIPADVMRSIGFDVKSSWRVVKTLKGHSTSVYALIQLSNGMLASGSDDYSIKLWDIKSTKCHKTLSGHTNWVKALTQLSTGVLASGSGDGSIKLWDVSNGECMNTISGHTNTIYSLTQLSNGMLASGSCDCSIKLWDACKGTCVNTLNGHSVRVLIQLANGLLASGSDDCTIQLWDVSRATCLTTLRGHFDFVYALVQLSTGVLASGSFDCTIKLWDVSTGNCLNTLDINSGPVHTLIQPSAGVLAAGSNDYNIKFWDISNGNCLQSLSGHSHTVNILLQLSSGMLASGSVDCIKLWEETIE